MLFARTTCHCIVPVPGDRSVWNDLNTTGLCSSTLDKKLSCRREAARCFVSLNISLSHSRTLKFIRNFTLEYDLCIIIISTTMFMVLSSWQSHCESSPGSFDECRMAPSGRQPKTKPDDLGRESACTGCQKLHPPSPFIITQPES